MTTPAGDRLGKLIDAFTRGVMHFREFSHDFSETYTEEGEHLDDSEITLYGPVHERLEWTTESPPAADRAWGWMDPTEFREWLLRNRSND